MTIRSSVSVIATLDSAAKILQGDARVAEHLGVDPSHIAHVRAGRRGLTMDQCAKLALLVGVDARDLYVADGLRRESNPEKRRWLERAFFLGAACSAVGNLLLSGYGTDALVTRITVDASSPAIHCHRSWSIISAFAAIAAKAERLTHAARRLLQARSGMDSALQSA